MCIILITLAVFFLALGVLTYVVRPVTVTESERGLYYREGRFETLLAPGRYWLIPFWSSIVKVDVRLRYATLLGQEVLCADNAALKLSIVASYDFADVALAINKIQNVEQAIHLELQQTVREVIGGLAVDQLLSTRKEIGPRITELATPRLAALGISLKSADIRDITFPGELKKIFSEELKARKEGLAALERARGETAALRHLANAAKMIESNPQLFQLRLLQSLGAGSGNTIVYGVNPADVPLVQKRAKSEKRPRAAADPETPTEPGA